MIEQVVLALDVGGSSVKSAVVADGRRIVGSVCVDAIQSMGSSAAILKNLAAIISGHLAKATGVNRIAFAFPGPFDYEQGISLIQNQAKYDALYGVHVSTRLREILRNPTLEMRYRNDAEAAILGEARYGAGIPFSRLIGLTLGTGLGSAFVAEGKVITQGDEVPPHGWLYSCLFQNRRADDVFSTRGLLTRLQERGIHAVDIASSMQTKENEVLAQAFASFGTDLGTFLEPFVLRFGAQAILVTGGIAETWERFAPSLSRSLMIPVLKGTLGKRAALLGAAALYF
jgi:glucokinase